jgi:hypothetical protein
LPFPSFGHGPAALFVLSLQARERDELNQEEHGRNARHPTVLSKQLTDGSKELDDREREDHNQWHEVSICRKDVAADHDHIGRPQARRESEIERTPSARGQDHESDQGGDRQK